MDRVRNLLEQIQNRLEELNKAERKVAEVILLTRSRPPASASPPSPRRRR
jgi:DNA-binding MurR/RpiR family transcriptional regulator